MEGENSKTFTELSQEVAEKFLHTIVFVDDQAEFIERERPKKLEKPGRRGGQGKDAQEISNERNTHKLDAKKVIDVFAWKGMVCSVLKPDKGEDPLGIATEAAKRADVLILDWRIYDDDGEKAMAIIGDIITSDLSENPRLRLIIVYTGEPNIDAISEKIKEKHCGDFNKNDGGFAFSQGHLRIVIFAKDGAKVPGEYSDRVISIDDLSDRVINEFAKITAGLVSNVALASLAVLRDNTHRIMGRLGHEMDPPYLAHRALLPNPSDAMNHMVDIIASEFHSLLDTYEVGEKANLKFIKAWIDLKNGERSSFEVEVGKDDIKSVDSAVIYELQNVGIEKANWYNGLTKKRKNYVKNHCHEKLTQTFCAEGADATELDHRFAILTSLKNRYGRFEQRPILTLGTIIKRESSESSNEFEKFWLCVQPRCDSVRIGGNRNFFFLPLEVVDGGKKFDLVLEDKENKFKKLRIHYKIYESANFKFAPDGSEEQVIRAKEENGMFVFGTTDKTRFEWVSELKSEHAQRIANDFAAKLSRVGLDESEWLRRWADQRD
jgi:hypothetical protein